MNSYPASLLNLLLYSAVVVVLMAGMVLLSYVLGGRHGGRAAGEPYESGVVATGSARLRFPAQFYIIAMFFVIFDLESVFLAAWAISIREDGWGGFVIILVFVATLAAVLVYISRTGAFTYASSGREILKAIKRKGGR